MLRIRVVVSVAALLVSAQPTRLMVACWGGTSKDIPTSLVASAATIFVVGNTYSDDYPVTVGHKLSQRWCAFATRLHADSGALASSTTVCSQGDATARGAAVDADGDLWIGGTTANGLQVTDDAAQRQYGGGAEEGGSGDGLLVRLSRNSGAVRYSSFLGGSSDDAISAVVTDGRGVWVAGHTSSIDLKASPNALQQHAAGARDGFIAYVNGSGQLAHLTYLGGNGEDRITSMAMADRDRLVFSGVTRSSSGPFGPSLGSDDGFIAVLNHATKQMEWMRRIGGASDDELRAVAMAKGQLVAVGISTSKTCRDFAGARDGWIVTLSTTGVVQDDRCIGGTGSDELHAVAAALDGTTWITGVTESADFSFARPAESSGYYSRALIARIAGGNRAREAFLLGSEQRASIAHSRGHAIAAARTGTIFIAGEGSGVEYVPTSGAFNAGQRFGSTDVFVTSLR